MKRGLRSWPGAAPEHQAFEELLAATLDPLYATALRLCRGRAADAEDLLQDAVLRAFTHRAELREAAAGRSWLFTILTRTHLNRVRAAGRRRESAASDLDDVGFEAALAEWAPQERADERAEREETRREIRAAIDALDDDLREVVLLTDFNGFSQRETAAIIGVPQGTVASRLFRARRTLRHELAKRRGQDKGERRLS
ncbi:RNA polymerase sigma factor SigR [soil metagenome]